MIDLKDNDFFEMDDDDFDTVLADDIVFSGNMSFSKPFMIKGNFSGKIDATSDLVVDTEAIVHADITANRVLIKGKVEGNITAETLVFVTSTGSVRGDILTPQIVLEPSCTFTGKCSMMDKKGIVQ